MNYLQLKKRAFMKVVNSIKGVVRTASGIPPLTLEGCVDDNSLINYTIHGNSIQNGTPTPEAPVEIESVGEYDEVSGKYKIPVVARGKNLIPFPYYTKAGKYNGITVAINTDGSITLDGKCTKLSNIYFVQTGTFSLSAGTYRVSLTPIMSGVTIITGGGGSNLASSVNENRIFTLNSEMPIGVCCLQVAAGAVINDVTFYPMIEAGTTATEYEPYVEPVTTNIYLPEPLRKVGEYADYIDFENQKVIRAIGSIVFNGTESWQISGTNDTDKYFYGPTTEKALYSDNAKCLCNIATTATISNNTTTQGCNLTWSRFRLRNANLLAAYQTVEAWKNWLKDNNITVIYPLGIVGSRYETITEEEDITLPQLPTFKGTTVYEVDTTTQPSLMRVDYYSNVKGD